MTDKDVALEKLTVFALVIAPVEPLINCTIGTDTKFVPVIVIVVAVAGAMVCDTSATVGLVSAASIQDNWFVELPLVAKTWFADPTDVGKIKVYDWPAEWAGDCILTPWEFCSQLSCNVPPLVFPFISTTPVPFGANNKSLFEIKTMPKHLDATDGLAAATCHYFQGNTYGKSKKHSNWKSFIKDNPEKLK